MTEKTPKFDPMQAMMRRRRADAESAIAPATDYDRLLEEFRQLQTLLEQKQSQIAALENGSVICPVTGLANAHALQAELERSLATARRYGRRHALLMLSVNDFASLTRQLGEDTTTQLLQHIARLIRQNIRPTDIAAHPQQARFAVILNELRAIENATMRAQQISDIIEQAPCIVNGRNLHAAVTYGLYVFGQDDELEDVIEKAQESMATGQHVEASN